MLSWTRNGEKRLGPRSQASTGGTGGGTLRIYFAAPQNSWERGSNENTNGLIRQYFPKGVSMDHLTQADCDRIAAKINRRPRKRYDWCTPEELYAA